MALAPCPQCGEPVSTSARQCPKCGTTLAISTAAATLATTRKGIRIPRALWLLLTVFVLFKVAGCVARWRHPPPDRPTGSGQDAAASPKPGIALHQAELGPAWPFKVASVELLCRPNPKDKASPLLLVRADGKTYPLIWIPAGTDTGLMLSDTDDIRRIDPVTGRPVPLQPVIEWASARCP